MRQILRFEHEQERCRVKQDQLPLIRANHDLLTVIREIHRDRKAILQFDGSQLDVVSIGVLKQIDVLIRTGGGQQ